MQHQDSSTPRSGPWTLMKSDLQATPRFFGEDERLGNGLIGAGFFAGQALNHNSGNARLILNTGDAARELEFARRHHGEGASALLRQLTDIETQVVRDLYRPKDGLILCPIADNLDWGAEYTEYTQVSGGGKAKIVSGIDPVVPQVEVGAKPIRDDVFTALVGYTLKYGRRGGNELGIDFDYVGECDALCYESLMELVDSSLLNLSSAGGVRGFLADKEGRVGNYTLPGAGGGEYLKDTSATEIVLSTATASALTDALIKLVDDVWLLSGKTQRANRLAMPDRLYTLIKRLKRDTGTDTTVMQYVHENSDLKGTPIEQAFVPVTDFKELVAAKGNQAARDVLCAYNYNPLVVAARIMSPRRFKVVEKTMGEMVIWAARFTPAQWKRPLGVQIRSAKWS